METDRVARSRFRVLVGPLATAIAVGSVLLAPAREAAAQESTKRVCIAASEKAQDLRHAGKLRAARVSLLQCVRPSCPALVRQDCSRWMGEVLAILPSVVIAAHGRPEQDLVDVNVTVDGETQTTRLDGKATMIDPGLHTFRFTAPGFQPLERQLLVRQGEQNRMLTVSLAPTSMNGASTASVADASEQRALVPPLAWGLGGVGVAALGSALALDLSAFSKAQCRPNCSSSEVSSVKTRTYLAGSLLGVGLLALGGAVVDVLVSPRADHATSARASSLRIDLATGGSGPALLLDGSF